MIGLHGAYCNLRPYREKDLPRMGAHFNTVEVYQMLRTPVPFTEEDALKRMTPKPAGTEHLFVIEVDGGYAGEIGIHSVKPGHMAELFYSLSPEFWGRGIMSEAIDMMCNWAFEEFQLIRLQAFVYHTNPASAHILEKCGFEREGILRKDTIRLGVLLDRYIYARLR